MATDDPQEAKLLAEIQNFIESYPLYKKLRIPSDNEWDKIVPKVIYRNCSQCNAERPFRPLAVRGSADGGAKEGSGIGRSQPIRFPVQSAGSSQPGIRSIPTTLRKAEPIKPEITRFEYHCTACESLFVCWVEHNYEHSYLWKVGQVPMWLPPISKDIAKELGKDAELYQKAIRNMNEGYGIGACAYLRRLLEKYINPLLELLYEVKKDQGASEEELADIKNVISKKDFTSKTEYAAEIAPASIMVEGFNPLKEIHDRLSIGLHVLDEEKANEYATVIRDALEFVIRRLRREHEERKAYAEKLKSIRRLTT
jgi:hypothetical protein